MWCNRDGFMPQLFEMAFSTYQPQVESINKKNLEVSGESCRLYLFLQYHQAILAHSDLWKGQKETCYILLIKARP